MHALLQVIVKEFLQLRQDRKMIPVLLVGPLAQLLALGHSNRQIAHQLFISEATVATHVWHILDKLDVRSRTLVAARSRELGLA